MNEVIEALLVAWGNEVISPALDVSIRSPLGTMDEEGARGVGGSRCLLTSVEMSVALSPSSRLVQKALNELAEDEPVGLGALGRVVVKLAAVRYGQQQKLQVREQCRVLGISERTYRDRVKDLHIALGDTLQRMLGKSALEDDLTPVELNARKRLERGRLAAKQATEQKRRMWEQRRAVAFTLAVAALSRAK